MNKHKQIAETTRTTGGLKSLSAVIMPTVRSVLGKKAFVIADLLTFWPQIAGEEMAEYTLPQKVDFKKNERMNGVLHLVVPSGAFALELQHREKFIVDNVNGYFGYKLIAGIRIIQDGRLQKQVLGKSNQPWEKKKLVSGEEQNYIISLTDGVCNLELKETLERLGKSIFRDNKQ